MAEMKVKNIPDELVAQVEIIYRQKGYENRSEFVVDILTKYCAFGSGFFVKELPETIRILVKNQLKEYPEMLRDMYRIQSEMMKENIRLLKEIELFFEPDSLEEVKNR